MRRPAKLIERDAEQECAEEPGAKADAGIQSNRCPAISRGGGGEHAGSEIRKVALHNKADNHGKPEHGEIRQHRGEAECGGYDGGQRLFGQAARDSNGLG